MFSGGTEVTITGSNFDSVAEPRVTLAVVVSGDDKAMSSTVTLQVPVGRSLMNTVKLITMMKI